MDLAIIKELERIIRGKIFPLVFDVILSDTVGYKEKPVNSCLFVHFL
ncbi:MAG: hypothetical protein KAT34_20525 [Candidatus Aminicenantes bacterium]|nr:hypothetical protein [Candidatus Aminicenantes bacterium]